MPRKISEPTLDQYDAEVHPAFATIGMSKVTTSPPGATLFDSDIQHQHSVVVRLHAASRKRMINRDWIHPTDLLFEVQMSEAQWASFVSSPNTGEGVPCTLRSRPDDYEVDAPPYLPRLRESMAETHEAADKAFAAIRRAMAEYEQHKTAANLRTLRARIENATANVDYAAKSLGEHAENVVQRARADIEAMVTSRAHALGIESHNTIALPSATHEEDLPS